MRDHAFHNNYTADGISGAIIAFAQYSRRHGLNIGVQETLDAVEAACSGVLTDPRRFKHALRALFCCQQEEVKPFNRLFDRFWDTEGPSPRLRKKIVHKEVVMRSGPASLVMLGRGRSSEAGEEGKNVSGANAVERLRRTDFSKVSEVDTELLEEIARKLWREMSLRLKRRLRRSATKGRVDLRRTIRRSISRGGVPVELVRRDKPPRKQRLVLLLDVSGSMDKYSFFLLRFIHTLQEHFGQVEAFTFSTRLQRITEYLRQKGLQATLDLLSQRADAWSSGTKIGECLRKFNERYAKRVLAGNSLTIVLSDGLDTGEPGLLAGELQKITLRTRRLVWLNPLKGMKDYAPTARGMAAALPMLDAFSSAHNLNSLLELENLLAHV
jgi:uncharacterized protein with von Willebrand factor type A (vWA) domain